MNESVIEPFVIRGQLPDILPLSSYYLQSVNAVVLSFHRNEGKKPSPSSKKI